jgi:hypothetical protein
MSDKPDNDLKTEVAISWLNSEYSKEKGEHYGINR